MKTSITRLLKRVVAATVAIASLAGVTLPAQTFPDYFPLTVINNFKDGDFYGADIEDSDIWIYTNFVFDYNKNGSFVPGNTKPGTYYPIKLSDIDQGKMRIYLDKGGSRCYAVLGSTAPSSQGDAESMPSNYFEWSWANSAPGTLDLSWIDSFSFFTKLVVDGGTSVTLGAGDALSEQELGEALQSYVNRPSKNYEWLGTKNGFSKDITFSGATDAVQWITNTQDTSISGSSILSLKNSLGVVAAKAADPKTPKWKAGTPETGPNWTDKGFRVARITNIMAPGSPAPSETPGMFSAYINFEYDSGSDQYTMVVTELTLYGATTPGTGYSYKKVWPSKGDTASTYYLSEADGLLDGIWTSSGNGIKQNSDTQWLTNAGGDQFLYAIGNAIMTGVIHYDDFVNNTPLPSSITTDSYAPILNGQLNYNFEILTNGAAVKGGKAGQLTGNELVALLKDRDTAGDLVNPYFYELMYATVESPAYMYPSQDLMLYTSFDSKQGRGINSGPISGDDFDDNSTLTWYIGSGASGKPDPKLTLTVHAKNGKVTNVPSGTSFDKGTEVTLTATPDDGYSFVKWHGSVDSTSNPVTITMDADMVMTAEFKSSTPPSDRYTLVTHVANGTIEQDPEGSVFDSGTKVTLTATADAGYTFRRWHGTENTTSNPLVVTMDADTTLTAEFVEGAFDLNLYLQGETHDGDWYLSEWFGWYYNTDNTSRWTYSLNYGWVYIQSDSNSDISIYSDTFDAESRGWWYTSKSLLSENNSLFQYSDSNWYSFLEVIDGFRWFYDFKTEANVKLGQIEFNVNVLLEGEPTDEENWYESAWFGRYNTEDPTSRWVFSDSLGGVYFDTNTNDKLWMYIQTADNVGSDWWYSAKDLMESHMTLYRQSNANWYDFIEVVNDVRWFYDYTTSEFLPLGKVR